MAISLNAQVHAILQQPTNKTSKLRAALAYVIAQQAGFLQPSSDLDYLASSLSITNQFTNFSLRSAAASQAEIIFTNKHQTDSQNSRPIPNFKAPFYTPK